MKEEVKRGLLFFAGALIAGISVFNFSKHPFMSFIGLMIGAYLIIKGLELKIG